MSVARPMIPPSASTSRTTVPFATPPMAGLHDICPILSRALVISPTRAPSRAAPTAITSKSSSADCDGRCDISRSYYRGVGNRMAQEIPSGQSMLIIRREAYERAGISRQSIDERLNLTVEEFRVDGRLVMIGPIPDDTGIHELLDDLEGTGLAYFDDYFELSGNWPSWIRLYVAER